ncbi:MarR family winged helix-turn-helix transcriptional regulator [Moritella sp.]|uniref:MarR family winged helix-turn-helix transcriptional regulator n=1 Tax=Moritella sp. TaxID=78556 RepID=UPI0025DDA2AF|nr:MarR family winged helix-turn-helix transcriptional regulator [Moritella sp.]
MIFKADDPTASIGLQFWNLYTKWNTAIAVNLKPLGLNHTQFVILAATLWCEKEQTSPSQAKISALTSIDKMTLSKALKRLVENKLVIKSKALNDSRSFVLKLSETGKDLTLQAISVVEKIDDKVFGSLGTAKKEKFLSLILEFNRFN